MIYRFFSLLFLLLALFWGCESSVEPVILNKDVQDPCDSTYQMLGDTVLQEPVDSVLIFEFLTISAGTRCWTIEEFAELVTAFADSDTTFSIYDYDFPLSIRLDNYQTGEDIQGSVNLFYLGWTEIDSNYAHLDRFLVVPEEKLGSFNYLQFSDIEITSLYMIGLFSIWFDGADIYPLNFIAKKYQNL